ncbi:MAG: heavy metal translocating P-type ATPase metal-binding domain-containing protein [Gammaproteobacteria bacterium]|nr:heavy metal translocating P-type ATPase metal-binding domain-containing protein [Gammaproteobacteria bacterium]
MTGNNEQDCFHCSLPVPKNSSYHVTIDGKEHAMCCPGCQAVAKAIVDGGLTSFYKYRTDTSPTARAAVPEVLQELTLTISQSYKEPLSALTKKILNRPHLFLKELCVLLVFG